MTDIIHEQQSFERPWEQAATCGLDEKTDRIRRHTLAELLDQYVAHQRAQQMSADHIEITGGMLRRLITATGWRTYRDVRVADVEAFFERPENAAWTVEYRIAWIKKVKAFVNWLRPKGQVHPLEELKRPSRRNAVQRKGRRVAGDAEICVLLAPTLPSSRRLAYALGLLNGLRRGEAQKLTWSDVVLENQPPILKIPPKDPGAQREYDLLPIHPLVVTLLREARGAAPASARVLPSVPDNKTIEQDLAKAGFAYKNEQGRLLCFHAFRHTFKHGLERVKTPPTPVRQLMRHLPRSVTDVYGQSELNEMRRYLDVLPSQPLDGADGASTVVVPKDADRPRDQLERLLDGAGGADVVRAILRMTLSADAPAPAAEDRDDVADGGANCETYVRHGTVFEGHSTSLAGTGATPASAILQLLEEAEKMGLCRGLSPADLKGLASGANVAKSGPGTQAD